MAVIRKSELKQMDIESLQKKIGEITAELNAEKGSISAARRPKNTKYKELKRVRARIKTILGERGVKA